MKRIAHHVRSVLLLVMAGLLAAPATAQIERRRAEPSGPVDEMFWAPNAITTATVSNVPKGNLNVTIMHSFGLVSDGIEQMFGLDFGANIRLGLDYGITDRISVGIGRQRFEKVVDFRTKVNLLRQAKDDSVPIELAVKGDLGIRTDPTGLEFGDRLNTFGSVMVARRFSDRVTVQITPMLAHFNHVFNDIGSGGETLEAENTLFGIALPGHVTLNDRFAFVFEYVPVVGDRSEGTTDALAVGLDIETGGHVFQLFFSSSQWLTEQHVLARNVDDFFEGDFRFGFNVNRVFSSSY